MTYRSEVVTNSSQYSVVTGNGILSDELATLLREMNCIELFLISDETVWSHHKNYISDSIHNAGARFSTHLIPPGESSKSTGEWIRAVDFLLKGGIRRNTPVLVVGGGVTGDLGGFAASTALRGVPLIHIPTTLLAMVDSAIGGKTGINHETGKNLIGTFYQPGLVVSDLHFLDTLPAFEWVNGLSEILKYGAIRNGDIFTESEIFLGESPLDADRDKLANLIHTCASIKAEIVSEDELEGGVRAFLNYGHTFAHALEKETGYQRMSHGEAVYLGMRAAKKLSELVMGSDFKSMDPIAAFRRLYKFRISESDLDGENLIRSMYSDKKRTSESLRFVLLKEWQHPVVFTVTNIEAVKLAWDELFRLLRDDFIP